MGDVNVMNEALIKFLSHFSQVYSNLLDPTISILRYLITFEVAFFGFSVMWGTVKPAVHGIKRLVTISIVVYVIRDWPNLQDLLLDSALYLGIKGSGGNVIADDIFEPSHIISMGLDLAEPMFSWIKEMGFRNVINNIGCFLLCLFAGLTTVISFFWLSLQIIVTLMQFYLSGAFYGFMLAWSVFKPTSWISQGALQQPVHFGVKICILAFFVGIADPIFGEMEIVSQEGVTFDYALVMALSSIMYLALALKLSDLAGGLISGTPSLGAGDLFGAGAASVGSAGATAVMGYGAGRVGLAAASQAASISANSVTSATKMASAAHSGAVMGAIGETNAVSRALHSVKGGVQGAVAASPVGNVVKDATARVGNSFNQAINQGRISGYTATGGSLQSTISSRGHTVKNDNFKNGVANIFNASKHVMQHQNRTQENHSGYTQGGKPTS